MFVKTLFKFVIPIILAGTLPFSCNNKSNIKDERNIIEQSESKHKINSDNLASNDFSKNIAGYYVDDEDANNPIELKILLTTNNIYIYELNTGSRNLKGTVHFSVAENNERYLILDGIKWEYWMSKKEGTGEKDEWIERPESELPDEIEAYIGENELVIQNYGNSTNNYLKFGDINKKYIQLKKMESY